MQEAADYYVERKERSGLNTFLIEHYGREPSRCDMHESLAHINRVKYIVTTNYDPLFERAYGDRVVAISRDEDLPKSTEYPDKTILLKIHGDITHPNTIVITSKDYEKFDSDTIVWSKIRTLLAEYSVVFIGYSLHDPNVEKMLRGIYTRLKGKKHPYFFISRIVDATKRKDLADHDLHFIEMDAISAIDYITGNAIEYSFVDGMKQPELLTKSDPIFAHQGFRVDRQISGGKVTHVSLVPMRPETEIKFTLSLSSKSGRGSSIQAFQNYITGQSVEPVKLSDEDCDIEIRNGKMNGVFVFDPSHPKIHEIQITPHPSQEITADLQLQTHPFKLTHVPLKIFKTDSLLKLEIQDPNFTFSLKLTKGSRVGQINFSSRYIISDIERARAIYTFFNCWILGDTIELITENLPAPFLIPSSPIIEKTPCNPPVHQLNQLYTDLSDIQNILKVKLTLPEKISPEEQVTIRRISAFIRGRDQHLNDLSITLANTEELRKNLFKQDSGVLRLSGEMWEEYSLFGRKLKIPFTVEGTDVVIVNGDEVHESIAREEADVKILWKSTTGQLFKKFDASSSTATIVKTPTAEVTP